MDFPLSDQIGVVEKKFGTCSELGLLVEEIKAVSSV